MAVSYGYTLLRLRVPEGQTLDAAETLPLGSSEWVRAAVANVCENVIWDEQTATGSYATDQAWYEFSIIRAAGADSLFVRSSLRQDSKPFIAALCDALGLNAFDAQAMLRYDPAARERGWQPFS